MKRTILVLHFILLVTSVSYSQNKFKPIYDTLQLRYGFETKVLPGLNEIDSLINNTGIFHYNSQKKYYIQPIRLFEDIGGYIIGISFTPHDKDSIKSFNYAAFKEDGVYVPDFFCLKFYQIQRLFNDANRCVAILSFNDSSLRKVNADLGFIYDLDMNKPFFNKYNKCKVVSFQNFSKGVIALYYFYLDNIKESDMLIKIFSQIGWIRFKES